MRPAGSSCSAAVRAGELRCFSSRASGAAALCSIGPPSTSSTSSAPSGLPASNLGAGCSAIFCIGGSSAADRRMPISPAAVDQSGAQGRLPAAPPPLECPSALALTEPPSHPRSSGPWSRAEVCSLRSLTAARGPSPSPGLSIAALQAARSVFFSSDVSTTAVQGTPFSTSAVRPSGVTGQLPEASSARESPNPLAPIEPPPLPHSSGPGPGATARNW